jgi:hypothetical protein
MCTREECTGLLDPSEFLLAVVPSGEDAIQVVFEEPTTIPPDGGFLFKVL